MKLDLVGKLTEASSTTVVPPRPLEKDAASTIDMDSVLSDSTAPTSNHYHDHRDDIINKSDQCGKQEFTFANNTTLEDPQGPLKMGVDSAGVVANVLDLSDETRDDPEDMNADQEDLMMNDEGYEDDEDDEMIEAEFETVLEPDDPILVTRSTQLFLSDEDDDDQDEDQDGDDQDDDEADEEIFNSGQHRNFGNKMPEFYEGEVESGEIEVEYIEPFEEGNDKILGDKGDHGSDVIGLRKEYEQEDFITSFEDSEIESAIADASTNKADETPESSEIVDEEEVSTFENPGDAAECSEDVSLSLNDAPKSTQTLLKKEYNGIVTVETNPEDITPSPSNAVVDLVEALETQGSDDIEECRTPEIEPLISDVAEKDCHEEVHQVNSLVDDSDTTKIRDSGKDNAPSVTQLAEKKEGSSDFPEDEKESSPSSAKETGDASTQPGNACLYPSTALPNATWSFDSALKTKKNPTPSGDGSEESFLTTSREVNKMASTRVEQHDVALEAATWSFDSTLKLRKCDKNSYIPTGESSMFPKLSTDEEVDEAREAQFFDGFNDNNADDLRSLQVTVGESVEMDTDASNSSDGDTFESTQGTAHQVDSPSEDFDATLERVAECIENQDWDSFVVAIKSRPSLAALSSADFSLLSSEASGFVSVEADGNLLLHEVCKNEPTSEAVSTLISLHEAAVKTAGQGGYLPLHIACASGASSSVVDVLLKAYPESVKLYGDDKMLPLHHSCKTWASEDVIKMLLTAHSAASIARDIYNHTAMYYALCQPEGREKEEILRALQLSAEHEFEALEIAAADLALMMEQKDSKIASFEMEIAKQCEKGQSLELELNEEKCKLSALEGIIEEEHVKLSHFEHESKEAQCLCASLAGQLEDERAKSTAIELELEEERTKLSSIDNELKSERAKLSVVVLELEEERAKKVSIELELKEERDKTSSIELELKEERSKLSLVELHLDEERKKYSTIQMQLKEEEQKSSSLQDQLQDEGLKLSAAELHLEEERRKSCSLKDKLGEELDRLNSTERSLQSSLSHLEQTNSHLEQTKSQLEKEQSTIFERFESLQKELSETKVLFLMEKQQLYRRSEKHMVEALHLLTETEEQLAIEKTQRLVERQELHEKAGRQLVEVSSIVDDAKKELEVEQNKRQEYEDLLQEKQNIVEQERERSKTLLLQFDRTKSVHMEKVKGLEEELLAQKTLIESQAKRIDELSDAIEKWESKGIDQCKERLAEEETLIGEIQAKIDHKTNLLQECKEVVHALERSNVLKADLLECQQKKIEALELARREKESQLKMNQEAMKCLEESIAQKVALEKREAEKVGKLKGTRAARTAAVDMEETQIKELDYKLARKQALIELEQMKEKTLEQTIAQKNELIESEKARIKELESVIAEKQLLLMSERNCVQALEATKAEKEEALLTEKSLIAEYRRALQEKDDLLERKKKVEASIQSRTEENERLLTMERKLVEELKASQAERESQVVIQKATVEEAEQRLARKESLVKREEYIAKCLERFASRKRDFMATGASSYFVHATVNMKFLLKEAFLVSGYEKAHIREHSTRGVNSMVRSSTRSIYESLVLKGPKVLSSFVRALRAKSFPESDDDERFSRHRIP